MQAVEVAISTVEDAWAVRLLDMMTGLQQLQVEGVTREMYIWGNIQVSCGLTRAKTIPPHLAFAQQPRRRPHLKPAESNF